MTSYTLGLDWISKANGWAYAKLQEHQGTVKIDLGHIKLGDESAAIIQNARCIVLDAPIGLPCGSKVGCKLRPCDDGARKWIGKDQSSSIFPVPYESELTEWKRRQANNEDQLLGHFRGLLPAIDSASVIRQHNVRVLESHPELVFAASLGQKLPASASKKTLLGALVRLSILRHQQVTVSLSQLEQQARIPTDNFLDAISMALVAHGWDTNNDLAIINDSSGKPMKWSEQANPTTFLMALPPRYIDTRTSDTALSEEVVSIANSWKN